MLRVSTSTCDSKRRSYIQLFSRSFAAALVCRCAGVDVPLSLHSFFQTTIKLNDALSNARALVQSTETELLEEKTALRLYAKLHALTNEGLNAVPPTCPGAVSEKGRLSTRGEEGGEATHLENQLGSRTSIGPCRRTEAAGVRQYGRIQSSCRSPSTRRWPTRGQPAPRRLCTLTTACTGWRWGFRLA